MKLLLISISIIILFWLSGNAAATSPQPEEVRPGPSNTVCNTHIVYIAEPERSIAQQEASATHTFDESIPKKEVLEKMTMYIEDKIKEWNVFEFNLDCKFPKVESEGVTDVHQEFSYRQSD